MSLWALDMYWCGVRAARIFILPRVLLIYCRYYSTGLNDEMMRDSH